VSKLSQFTSNLGDDHWCALEQVMHYLTGTMDYKIHYSGHPTILKGYSDANWIYGMDELYATSEYIFTLSSAAVSWRSCKQTILTRSTMKAELTTLDTTIVEVDWLRELLINLPIIEKSLPTILMNYDNQIMIVEVDNSKDNMKSSSHIKRWLKFVRKIRNSEVVTLDYIHIEKNLANPLTKGLSCNVIDAARVLRRGEREKHKCALARLASLGGVGG
jgi:hypothetical protein